MRWLAVTIGYVTIKWLTNRSQMHNMDVFEKKPSKGTVQNDLLMMVKLGLSEKYGDGPSTKYKVK